MASFVIRRIIALFFVLCLAVTLTFCLLRMKPGSPFAMSEKNLTKESIEQQEIKYNLDGGKASQCLRYLGLARNNSGEFSGLLQGEFQPCLKYRDRNVGELIAQTLPVSATLGALAFLIASTGGIWLGSLAAVRKHTWVDRTAMLAALAAVSIPTFVVGPAVILVFSLKLGWFPVGGLSGWSSLVLPSLTLALPFMAYIARLTRTSMMETLHQDFVRTARAKGVSENGILYRHALKVAILPVVSYMGPLAASLLTGGLVVESVFSLPGMGGFFVNSVLNGDVFLCCGAVVVYCTLLVAMNLFVDVSYTWLDRRIKIE